MKAMRLVVSAPPDRWAWGMELGTLPEPTPAQPVMVDDNVGKHWRYNTQEKMLFGVRRAATAVRKLRYSSL